MNGVPLENVNVFNDLGLLVSHGMSWNLLIDKIVKKARSRLSLV